MSALHTGREGSEEEILRDQTLLSAQSLAESNFSNTQPAKANEALVMELGSFESFLPVRHDPVLLVSETPRHQVCLVLTVHENTNQKQEIL